jgi:hypothetical protein
VHHPGKLKNTFIKFLSLFDDAVSTSVKCDYYESAVRNYKD